MRAPWKIKFIDQRIFRDSFYQDIPFYKVKYKRVNAHTYLRGVRIPSTCLNKRVGVFNGHSFSSFIVKSMMIGRKFGEFSLTKKLGKIIHKKKRRKKKIKK